MNLQFLINSIVNDESLDDEGKRLALEGMQEVIQTAIDELGLEDDEEDSDEDEDEDEDWD